MVELIENEIELIIDSGISIEIKDFFSSDESIESFKVEVVNDKYYDITVKFKDYSYFKAKDEFQSFVTFMQYSYITAYEKEVMNEETKYYFVTASEDKKGFKCLVSFS